MGVSSHPWLSSKNLVTREKQPFPRTCDRYPACGLRAAGLDVLLLIHDVLTLDITGIANSSTNMCIIIYAYI